MKMRALNILLLVMAQMGIASWAGAALEISVAIAEVRNASIMDFLHSDYAVVNERLAGHYRIPNVYGPHFRKVDIQPQVLVFLEKRAGFLEAQQAQQASLANIVRREVDFLRSNSKAQRTKSKARIEEAYLPSELIQSVVRRLSESD